MMINDIIAARKRCLLDNGFNPMDLEKWGIRLRNQRSNAKIKGVICDLSFDEYIGLAAAAGITEYKQIGTSINSFHLCRVGDIGNYALGNCDFKPHYENVREKVLNGGTTTRRVMSSKQYRITSPGGEVFVGVNLTEFCRQHNLNDGSSMARVCKGLKSNHKGWKGEYVCQV